MKAKLAAAVCVLALVGCARFSTKQTDLSYGTDGKPLRGITTKATACTFWSSSSQLANFKATQTDKTQGATVGTLNQSADTSTNLSAIVRAVAEGVVSGLK